MNKKVKTGPLLVTGDPELMMLLRKNAKAVGMSYVDFVHAAVLYFIKNSPKFIENSPEADQASSATRGDDTADMPSKISEIHAMLLEGKSRARIDNESTLGPDAAERLNEIHQKVTTLSDRILPELPNRVPSKNASRIDQRPVFEVMLDLAVLLSDLAETEIRQIDTHNAMNETTNNQN